ncbi:hypothetical protein [Lacrimispora amygdalina]|uniref:hypothetical protein n=1 Tax=Lacrimispora amygdalina TaxID=253257 RepID=UPI0011C18F9B|nr:hypothetical protein [Clostridium indicum]
MEYRVKSVTIKIKNEKEIYIMGLITDLLFATGVFEPSNKPKDLDALTRDNLSGKYTKWEMRRRLEQGYYDKKD